MNKLLSRVRALQPSAQVFSALAWVFLITGLVEWLILDLSQMGSLVMFLFLVVSSAYYFSLRVSLGVALLAYLLLNYLVVEPRYSLHVPDARSWIVLVGFLLISLRINTLVHSLKMKSLEAELAVAHHRFARQVSEALVQQGQVDSAVKAVQEVLQRSPGVDVQWLGDLPAEALPHIQTLRAGWCVQVDHAVQGPCWLMPVLEYPAGVRYLHVRGQAVSAPYLVKDNLQLACDQLNSCVKRIVTLAQVQEARLKTREEEVRSSLLASFSHDMRTPLTAILGAATALRAQHEQPHGRMSEAEIRQLLLSIEAEAFHMASSCENILSLVRLKSLSRLPQPLPWQSPLELVEATVRRYELRSQGRALAVDSPSEPPLLQADAVLLTQALSNLIDNACALHEAAEPVGIQVRSVSRGEHQQVEISVLDRGPGFPAGLTPEGIKPFHPSHRASAKGFGLGLVIAKTILDLHEARLEWTARPGGGSVVSMVFVTKPPSVDSHAF